MPNRKWILLFVSCAVLALIYTVPFYGNWIRRNFLLPGFSDDLSYETQHMDEEERRALRFGPTYPFFKSVSQQIRSTGEQNVTILLPPNDYAHKMGFQQMEVPEPAVFYYFTGLNSVNQNSLKVRSANWALITENGSVYMNRIKSQSQLDTLLALYKPYKN
jgi:hypothetical protein